LENFLEHALVILKSRLFVLGIIVAVLFSILIFRIFDLQIINEEYYLENYIQKSEKEVLTSGSRGRIYDRNGVLLAYNELAYAVVIEDNLDSSDDKDEKLNTIAKKTCDIITGNGDTLTHDFAIIIGSTGEYEYHVSSDTERLGFLRDIYGKKAVSELGDKENTTPDEAMKYLKEKFEVDNSYSKEDALNIVMVRYNMSLNAFQKYITTEVASNVSEETVAAIYEASADLQGVSIVEQTNRIYNDSIYFSHIIGYTGKISDSELSEYNSQGGDYISTDYVGKLGIEKEMETYLQGKKGKNTIYVNNTGLVLETVESTEAEAGQDVYLTIDSKLQKAAYTILEQKLAGILYSKIVNQEVVVTDTSKTIPVGIKDVYYQMINNNVLNLDRFALDTASDNEKRIYSVFSSRQGEVLSWINSYLNSSTADGLAALPEENREYLEYVYDLLTSETSIIDTSLIDSDDSTYQGYVNGSVSLRGFILYAISKNWINTTNLEDELSDYSIDINSRTDSDGSSGSISDDKYYNTDELYNNIVNYINLELSGDSGFSKKIYYYLVHNGSVSGNMICLALYDQGVLEYDENQYASLSAGGSAYDFMKEQIRTLKITPSQVALDPCSGSLVITSSNSGEVLAMVTYPSYDNNLLSGTVDADYWGKLNNDLSLPLYNRATQTRTAPGSTFKMVSAITGMEEGIIYPGRTIQDLGEFTKITPSPKCWKYPSNHGAINVSQALEVSCNYFFYEVGYELSMDSYGNFTSDTGLNKLMAYASQFGLTEKSGVEIEENEPEFSTDNSVTSAIGQGSHAFANIQLARYVNTISNSGNNYKLSLLDKVVDTSGNVVVDYTPELVNTTSFSQSTWDAVHYGMRLVCTSGTAKNTFQGFSINVAGKSGTAQENLLRSNHSLFVAYAPYENPEIALSVMIPNGESSGYTAEIVRDVIKYYYNLTTDAELYGGTASIPTSGITSD